MFALIASLFSRRTPVAPEKSKLGAYAHLLARKCPKMAAPYRRQNLARYDLLLKLTEQHKSFTLKQVAETFKISNSRANQIIHKYRRHGVVRRLSSTTWKLTDLN